MAKSKPRRRSRGRYTKRRRRLPQTVNIPMLGGLIGGLGGAVDKIYNGDPTDGIGGVKAAWDYRKNFGDVLHETVNLVPYYLTGYRGWGDPASFNIEKPLQTWGPLIVGALVSKGLKAAGFSRMYRNATRKIPWLNKTSI